MVAAQGAKWVTWGALAGLAGAVLLGRILSGVVFEVSLLDPATFASVTLILVAVAFVSNWLPGAKGYPGRPHRDPEGRVNAVVSCTPGARDRLESPYTQDTA